VPDISIWHRGWHITPALATGCRAYLRGRLAQRLLRQDPGCNARGQHRTSMETKIRSGSSTIPVA
jgi:hypothetical protein